jgi:hypothetical protein
MDICYDYTQAISCGEHWAGLHSRDWVLWLAQPQTTGALQRQRSRPGRKVVPLQRRGLWGAALAGFNQCCLEEMRK